jgi:hypothetical protein
VWAVINAMALMNGRFGAVDKLQLLLSRIPQRSERRV